MALTRKQGSAEKGVKHRVAEFRKRMKAQPGFNVEAHRKREREQIAGIRALKAKWPVGRKCKDDLCSLHLDRAYKCWYRSTQNTSSADAFSVDASTSSPDADGRKVAGPKKHRMDVMRENLKMKVQIKTLINFKWRAMRRERQAATDRETPNNNDADTDAGSSEDGNNSQGGEESWDNESPVKLGHTILDSCTRKSLYGGWSLHQSKHKWNRHCGRRGIMCDCGTQQNSALRRTQWNKKCVTSFSLMKSAPICPDKDKAGKCRIRIENLECDDRHIKSPFSQFGVVCHSDCLLKTFTLRLSFFYIVAGHFRLL